MIKKTMACLFTILVCTTGCTSVAPWERGNLARSDMALTPFPNQTSVRNHQYGSREAGSVSSAIEGGGGCGCY